MEYTENHTNSYASKGVGNTALGLSIGALGLEVLGGALLGGMGVNKSSNTYTKDLAEKDAAIAELKSQQIVDTKLVDVYKELRTQDKSQDAAISNLKDRVAAIEVASPLREQIVMGQIQNVANSVTALNDNLSNKICCSTTNLQNQIFAIDATLKNITSEIVPASAVCPQPMTRYNSWVAPTSAV